MKKTLLTALALILGILLCNSQWVQWPMENGGNGHFYLPVATNVSISWREADQVARSAGGYLATVTSEAENAFVFGLVNSPTYFIPEGPLLGGYQLPNSQEPGTGWTWVTGEPWGYTKWGPGQPDNGGEQEDSIHFSSAGGGTWNDKSSTGQYHRSFIIERDGSCTPRAAKATAQTVNGFVIGATVIDGGCGYTNPPAVLIRGGGGSGAQARAVVSNGQVTAIQILDAGIGYTSVPRVLIGSPPFVPTVFIETSRVKVTQNVVLGWNYVLETSTNALTWIPTGPPFTAESETIVTEFDVDTAGRQFRLRVTP